MTWFNLESRNFPGYFIRHRNLLGELTPKDDLVKDFAFNLVMRGEKTVALQSVNFLDRCLRHREWRVRLEGPASGQDSVWHLDSSFFLDPGLADRGGYSFRSMNYPDRYIRHRDFHLWVEAPSGPQDDLFRNDATFYLREAP